MTGTFRSTEGAGAHAGGARRAWRGVRSVRCVPAAPIRRREAVATYQLLKCFYVAPVQHLKFRELRQILESRAGHVLDNGTNPEPLDGFGKDAASTLAKPLV